MSSGCLRINCFVECLLVREMKLGSLILRIRLYCIVHRVFTGHLKENSVGIFNVAGLDTRVTKRNKFYPLGKTGIL